MRIFIACLLLFGCVSRGNFDQLPRQDQQRFARCMHPMQPVLCGDDKDTVYVTMCLRGAEANYSEAPGANGRRRWLVENGCPPSMVNPAAYAGDSEDEDRPQRRSAQSTTPGQVADEE